MNRKQVSNDWRENNKGYLKEDKRCQDSGHDHHHDKKFNPLEMIEELDNDQMSALKSKTVLLNKDKMLNSEVNYLQSLMSASLSKPVQIGNGGKKTVTDKGESLFNLFKAFENVMVLRRKDSNRLIPCIKHEIVAMSKEERTLFQSQVFNNVTETLLSPILYQISRKKYTIRLTPIQASKKDADEEKVIGDSSSAVLSVSSKTRASRQKLQDHIIQSYFDESHLTIKELIYVFEIETNSFCKKFIVSLDSELVIFVFEWEREPSFLFLLCFRLTSKLFIQSYNQYHGGMLKSEAEEDEFVVGGGNHHRGGGGGGDKSRLLHIYRQDITGNDEERQNEADFFTYTRGQPRESNLYKVLFNGTKIHEDVLWKLGFSTIEFVHYGYAPQDQTRTNYLL